jgi:predicted SprT family Zn-dependent metalloprotease
VDFCNKEEAVHGRMVDDIQAKTTVNSLSIHDLIENMKQHDVLDERRPVIFWRQTGKSAGGKFMVKGHFAISVLEDHVKLLQHNELSRMILPHLSGFLEYLKDKDFEAAAAIAKRAEELGF